MSSLGTLGSFTTLITVGFPGFLLYSILSRFRTDPGRNRRETHESEILRFNPPGMASFRCVKNSVLNGQLIRGSGSCGELTPKENQSSFNIDAPTNFRAPSGMVRSDEMDSCRLTTACTTMYMFLFVLEHVSELVLGRRVERQTSIKIRGLGLLDLPNFVNRRSHRQENSACS